MIFTIKEFWYTRGTHGRPARGSLEFHLKYKRKVDKAEDEDKEVKTEKPKSEGEASDPVKDDKDVLDTEGKL